MDSSLKLQMDIKNNAQDLQNYVLDLKNWEEEMKKKEMALNHQKPTHSNIPPPRNKAKKSKPETQKKCSNKPEKISGYDYSAWDKFDVEKACADLDEEDTSDKESVEIESQETEDTEIAGTDRNENEKERLLKIDEAFYEKQLGNQFVKKEQWSNAIKCYTNSINLDPNNPIYYANRALCFLKLKNFKSAEVDATVAIQLDKTYMKAFQRRAVARLALGQLAEAKSDYEEVLKIEPKNALAKTEIQKIDQKLSKESQFKKTTPQPKATFNPKEIFKSEEKKPKVTKNAESSKIKSVSTNKIEEVININRRNQVKEPLTITEITDEDIVKEEMNLGSKKPDESVEESSKSKTNAHVPNHTRFTKFKPLPEWCSIIQPVYIPPHKRSKKPLQRINVVEVDEDPEESALVDPSPSADISSSNIEDKEKTVTKNENVTNVNKYEDDLSIERLSLEVPKTSIQFINCWKILRKNPEQAFSYLKKIPGNALPKIFENSLESDFFSELITFLASQEKREELDFVYNFLLALSNVKRFSSLVLFMSAADRACVSKCISELKTVKSEKEISELMRLYEL